MALRASSFLVPHPPPPPSAGRSPGGPAAARRRERRAQRERKLHRTLVVTTPPSRRRHVCAALRSARTRATWPETAGRSSASGAGGDELARPHHHMHPCAPATPARRHRRVGGACGTWKRESLINPRCFRRRDPFRRCKADVHHGGSHFPRSTAFPATAPRRRSSEQHADGSDEYNWFSHTHHTNHRRANRHVNSTALRGLRTRWKHARITQSHSDLACPRTHPLLRRSPLTPRIPSPASRLMHFAQNDPTQD